MVRHLWEAGGPCWPGGQQRWRFLTVVTSAESVPHSRRWRLQAQLEALLPPDPELVLVTDLDGTLLGGDLLLRRRFYAWLAQQRHRVLHVFSTGRDLRSVARLLEEEAASGLAAPHLVIGDVGCTVACGVSLRPIPLAVEPIERRWRGKPEQLAPVLAAMSWLTPQPVSADRRLAYLVEPGVIEPADLAAIEAHGVDCLVSDDRYLDVLPAGVNKGTTLIDLLGWLEIDPERVVTAGDTLNDLAMFETGLRGVMVGNAEPALVACHNRLPRTYRASGTGCAGIVEGLRHFGFDHLLPPSVDLSPERS
jgi:hydroxymethylpyrimidine pyrophosphatase-like HAD family hydrolase